MNNTDISKVDTEKLLDVFVQLSLQQGEAHDLAKPSLVNRLGDRLYDISDELIRRTDDRGRSLLKLFEHPNTQVRFNAATSVSGLFTKEARQAIQIIADSSSYLTPYAKMYLRTLDEWVRKQES